MTPADALTAIQNGEVMTELETLREARRLLLEKGWVKGKLWWQHEGSSEPDAYCLVGAISASMPGEEDDFPKTPTLRKIIYGELGYKSFLAFNDSPHVTFEHVLAAIDKAINQLEAA